jgi:hypothetical protein
MFRTPLAAALGAATVVTTLAAASTAYAAQVKVLDLELNEPSGATVAVDTSGQNHNGRIGSLVRMNGSFAHFPLNPGDVDLNAAPLILVNDAADGSLDPGSGAFTVEMRYRTTYGENVLQKGQATTTGGQWKMQLERRGFVCLVKTAAGSAAAGSGSTPVKDGNWHTVKCVRTPTSVDFYVDGKRTGHSSHTTGTLNNSRPWSLGGKENCNGSPVTCDYFNGDVDYVRMWKG